MSRDLDRKLQALALRNHINAQGGLVGQGDLAREWSLSRPRIQELVEDETFPEAVASIGPDGRTRRLWGWEQCRVWREHYFGMKRKAPTPRKRHG